MPSVYNLSFKQTENNVLAGLNKSYSPQCKTVVLSAVINTVNSIWFARNQIRLNISKIHWRYISSIMAQVNLSENLTQSLIFYYS